MIRKKIFQPANQPQTTYQRRNRREKRREPDKADYFLDLFMGDDIKAAKKCGCTLAAAAACWEELAAATAMKFLYMPSLARASELFCWCWRDWRASAMAVEEGGRCGCRREEGKNGDEFCCCCCWFKRKGIRAGGMV